MTYATDGKCHNAERGTFGHECGKPATWIGTTRTGFRSGYCDACKSHGYEARDVLKWETIKTRKPARKIDVYLKVPGGVRYLHSTSKYQSQRAAKVAATADGHAYSDLTARFDDGPQA